VARVLSRAYDVSAERSAAARPRRRARLAPWLYLLPAFAVYAVFWAGPAAYSVYLSFFDWDMASPTKTFVALDNYPPPWGLPSPRPSALPASTCYGASARSQKFVACGTRGGRGAHDEPPGGAT
jgi:hypothetical protein